MAINYLTLKRAAALRLAQIIGATQATLETSYTDTTFSDMLDGAEIPLTAFQDQILNVERELVQIIGNTPSHPARSYLYGASAELEDLDSTPIADADGNSFFGMFDSCSDADSNRPLTWMPTQVLTDILDNGADFFGDTPFYYYNITGNFIRCTRPSVILQGVSWNYGEQVIQYEADGDSPLPDGITAAWIDGVTARAAQVGWVAGDLFAYYDKLYEEGLMRFGLNRGNVPLSSANVVAG